MIPKASERTSDDSVRVLLVDDQVIVGEAVRRLLAEEGDIVLRYCADAHEAIGQARQIKPTVILQDLVMPGIDGIELVREFRQTPETADTPILVLSSKEDPRVKGQAFAAGANDYLVKLPDAIELIARIRYHSAAYLNRLQRDEAFQALRESRQQLLDSNAALLSANKRLAETAAEIHSLNAALENQIRQVETTNKELEAFSYSVSHDLRTPLHGIDGFSQMLLEDYADRLGEEGIAALQHIRAASLRMAQLIDDLLALAYVTRIEMSCERVDLSVLVCSIAEELQKMEPGRQVEWGIADSLTVHADARLLRIALENLLGNAWKYTGKQAQARIEFGITQQESRPVYFLRDNGAGFDMAHANKLFGVFQRLHGATEFPGTGIGLATVQRILLRHGGQVWAEGAVGQGATFYFTL
jgi:light-regulated signal transduction histidine kinase (bacteriophytochrome)